MESVFLAVVMLFVAGLGAGTLAGMLGVGGGIILVPVIFYILKIWGLGGDSIMHIAVATSLATIIPTSIVSTLSHARRSAVDWPTLRQIALYIIMGTLFGAYIADLLRGQILSGIFGGVAFLVALRLLMVHKEVSVSTPEDEKTCQGNKFNGIGGILIGFLSSLMGIGGGTFSVPMLVGRGFNIHRAVGTSAAIGFIIAVPGTLGFMISGLQVQGLPDYSIGYVNLVVFALIVPATMLASPWGARIAHSLSPVVLRRSFGVILLIISTRMIVNSFFWSP